VHKKLTTVLAGGVTTVALAVALTGCSGSASSASGTDAAGTKKIVIAEPVHGIGYLPLYVAIDKGYFTKAGLDVSTTTLTGGAHVNAVLSGDAWGFIGGIESAAIANAKGSQLEAVAGVVDRANVYWVARKGVTIDPSDIAGSLKGKTVAAGRHAGSPEIDTLYYLKQLGLDPTKDVTILNNESGSELSVLQSKQADVAVTSEPVIGQGVTQGVSTEPFVNLPEALGKFAYSDIVTSKANTQKDPGSTQKFVDALSKGIDDVLKDHDEAAEIAAKEFPNMSADVIKRTLARAYDDKLWDSVEITPEALDIDLKVARDAGLLDDSADPATYDDIVNTAFFKND
jgi:NitT/TauT family transport system substrate-binding protein